jgi:hypothetical protein
VFQDWREPLNSEKTAAYVKFVQKLEMAYAMFSVSLDEALGMRRVGRTGQARQMLGVSPALCERLSIPLGCLLKSMPVHARYFGIAPNLVPLHPANFQSPRSQSVARFNELFSKLLLTRKSHFVQKISTLEDLLEELEDSFVKKAEQLAEDESLRPERDWELLDAVHYDLNTCRRETAVLYKSFPHAEGQLEGFQCTLDENTEAAGESMAARAHHLAHRRMVFLKGQ